MTPEEFAECMRGISEKAACLFEENHIEADDLMCEALRELGFQEGVRIFEDEIVKEYSY